MDLDSCCPYCDRELLAPPKRARECRHCGYEIHIRPRSFYDSIYAQDAQADSLWAMETLSCWAAEHNISAMLADDLVSSLYDAYSHKRSLNAAVTDLLRASHRRVEKGRPG